VKLGFTALSLAPDGPALDGQAELLAREVIPAVRQASDGPQRLHDILQA
jgi:hypothetical protein